jgi:hypothetical protein
MRPIYTAFHTPDSLYEAEAARLRGSLDALGLPHDIREVADRGSWEANSQLTCDHIVTMMDAYPDRPIVQLDADAYVWKRPALFEDGMTCDIAYHRRKGIELLNGTLYIAPTPGARLVIERYRDGVKGHPNHANEQHWLQVAVDELGDLAKIDKLPAGYCWIHDVMKDDLAAGEEVIIEHLQASREGRNCHGLPRRLERLAQIQKMIDVS